MYIYLDEPLTSGLADVVITVSGDEGTFETTTQGQASGGIEGFWVIDNVPEGEYTVTAELEGWCFEHVTGGTPGALQPLEIAVNQANQQTNQSIQFLAHSVCACVCGTVEVGGECGCPYDITGNGVVDLSDLSILLGAWGPSPDHCADFDLDESVNAIDLAALLGAWGACP